MTDINKTDNFIYAGLFCTAFFICLISCLNPFGLKTIDTDTSVFLTIAQGITRGQIPFRDFYDNKGPLLYLISAPGFALGRFTGVWITELIFMCTSVIFAYKTALFFGNRGFAFIGVITSFIVFQSFFYEVAGTEEYSLPFMMISLYIFTKYYFSHNKISPLEIIILGFCFAVSILLRINFFPLWLAFCIVICIETIYKHDFIGLGKYIILFCIGIAIVIIPTILYLKINNALWDYFNQNFIVGSLRGLSGFSLKYFVKYFFIIIGKNLCFTPLLAGYVWIIKAPFGNKIKYYIGYLLAFILTVMLHAVIRANNDHYNMVLTPFLVPAFTFFAKDIYKYFVDIKNCKLYFTIFICILLSMPLVQGLYHVYSSMFEKSRNEHILTGKTIDEHTVEGDKIIFLGFPCRIYLFTQRDTASRYIYQAAGVDYDPKAQDEFLLDIYNKKPAIIVIENRDERYDYLPEWYAPIYNLIENEYRMITDENGYFLFKLKEERRADSSKT